MHLLERPLYSRALGGQPPHRNFFPAKNRSCAFACGGRGLDAALTSMAGRERERERESEREREREREGEREREREREREGERERERV